jgi:hypothetical protein
VDPPHGASCSVCPLRLAEPALCSESPARPLEITLGRFVGFRFAALDLPGGGSNAYYSVCQQDVATGLTRKVSLSSAAMGYQSNTNNC